MAAAPFRLFGDISKVEEQDDGTIKVHGIASTGSKDSAGETVTAKAMADALPEYEQFPALREMHQLSAAGSVIEAMVDGSGATFIVAHVIDPVAIQKVKLGVYRGFSIGGKALERDPHDRTTITKLKLNEISLVDRPCNPDAVITMWKADAATEEDHMKVTPWAPANADVIAKADALAKAAGKTSRSNFVVAARNALLKAHDDEVAELEAIAKADADAALAAEAEVTAAIAEAEVNAEIEKADGGSAVIEPEPVDRIAELEAAIEKAAAAAVAPVTEPDDIVKLEDLGRTLEKLDELYGNDPLRKGLRGIASLSYAIYQVVGVQRSVQAEAAREGDKSTVPAAITEAVNLLGAALVSMAQEEVAELLVDLGPDQVVIDPDQFYYAAQNVDIVKADTALMEKVGARNAKRDIKSIQAIHDEAMALGAACELSDSNKASADDDIRKAASDDAIAKATAQLGAMTEVVDTLRKRIADLESAPAPAKVIATPAGLAAISKVQDLDPGSNDASGTFTKADVTAYLDGLSEKERGMVLVKMALSQPISARG